MARSKDIRRYGPVYQDVLIRMEAGDGVIRISFAELKDAQNCRLMLYGYAHAWENEALNLGRQQKAAEAAIASSKATTMAKYLLQVKRSSGPKPFVVVCTHRELEELPDITSEGHVEQLDFKPNEADEAAAKQLMLQHQEEVIEKFFPIGGSKVQAPIESSREDITGPDEDRADNAALPGQLIDKTPPDSLT